MGQIKTLKLKDLPEHKKILWLIADNITNNDILSLAEQGCGCDIHKHAELIAHFKQTLDTSKFQSWHPIEVLELNRWSPPGYLDRMAMRAALLAVQGYGPIIQAGWATL